MAKAMSSSEMVPTVISLFPPHPSSLSIALPEETTLRLLRRDVLGKYLPVERQKLLLASGRPLGLWNEECTIADVLRDEEIRRGESGKSDHGEGPPSAPQTLFLQLGVRMCGGKGGFGSQLRAAGGRMSSSKKSNRHRKKTQDEVEAEVALCRDLNGRRIKTITEARQLATHLENAAERDRVKEEARLKKLEQAVKLVEASQRAARGTPVAPLASSSLPAKRGAEEVEDSDATQIAPPPSTEPPRERFGDRDFLKEKAKISKGVKNAVAQAMAAKRAKTNAAVIKV